MSTPIDRREFLALSSGAALATQFIRSASGQSQVAAATSAANDPSEVRATGAKRWDYVAHPVAVDGDVLAELSLSADFKIAARAFDGYGAQGARPAAVRAWQVDGRPNPAKPASCVIDYRTPVAVSAFVHYCYVPDGRDLRWLSPVPSAFQTVRISARSGEQEQWRVVTTLERLPAVCPQVLAVPATEPAQYWRLEVLELVPGAEMLASYEIETYTGGVPQLRLEPFRTLPLPAAFAERMRTHRPATGTVTATVTQTRLSQETLAVSLAHHGQAGTGDLQVLVDGAALALLPKGPGRWEAALLEGLIAVESQSTAMGLLFDLTYTAHADQPVKYRRATVQLSVPQGRVYYMPAYMWQTSPSDIMVPSVNVQTRLAAIGTRELTVSLIPGTDRGKLGFQKSAIHNELLLGTQPMPVLLTAVAGDWWDTYRMAVQEIYGFHAPAQTVPVSEIQYGISRYMLEGDGIVWEPALGTVRSWPRADPESGKQGNSFCAFSFYGVPYSLPVYWARFVMSGEELARKRCRSIVQWLCHSGIRVKEGPARGAFFSQQTFNGPIDSDTRGNTFLTQGVTQAATSVLTSQATGSALWALMYYRAVSGEQEADIDQAIDEGIAWLLRSQLPDGGWPYGYDLSGRVAGGAASSGSIWNIWALWRLGTATGNQQYLEAAAHGTAWFAREFVTRHHYHGYWEDVGPGSREGYDAALAAVALGEMGQSQLAVEAAKDAAQWIFTRQIECRDDNNSMGLVAEQTGWPPAAYCNPMMALSCWTAWQLTKDPFWESFAMIPKAIGWWYQPDSGAMVWIYDATSPAPMVGHCRGTAIGMTGASRKRER